jgi:hypothetical protein
LILCITYVYLYFKGFNCVCVCKISRINLVQHEISSKEVLSDFEFVLSM